MLNNIGLRQLLWERSVNVEVVDDLKREDKVSFLKFKRENKI